MGSEKEAGAGLDESAVILFGTETCKICHAAIEKLERMRIPYRKIDLAKCAKADLPEDWRDIDLAGAQAFYELRETLPWIRVGDSMLGYAEAMKALRSRGRAGAGAGAGGSE